MASVFLPSDLDTFQASVLMSAINVIRLFPLELHEFINVVKVKNLISQVIVALLKCRINIYINICKCCSVCFDAIFCMKLKLLLVFNCLLFVAYGPDDNKPPEDDPDWLKYVYYSLAGVGVLVLASLVIGVVVKKCTYN